jgi:hypothetical protein
MKEVRKEIWLSRDQIKELKKLAGPERHSVKSYIEKIVDDHLMKRKIKEGIQ